jgi:hypothetical protein
MAVNDQLPACGLPAKCFPMSDINLPPTAADNEIPIPVDDVLASSSSPEQATETLYIQNLNEKIRIDGSSPLTVTARTLTISPSPQGIFAWPLQVVR